MPELPECEANRRRVQETCLNRTIVDVVMGETSHVDLPAKAARDRLIGRQFTRTQRHGKAIFAGSDSGPWIHVSLGMTGTLRPYDVPDDAPDFARITFVFEGGRRLAFCCPRKLGSVSVIDHPDDWIAETGLGPDAMSIGRDRFADVIGKTRGAVKPAIMAQNKIAGIGNIWSDEILFHAGIAPQTRADTLQDTDIDRIYDSLRAVLCRMIENGADYGQIPRNWLCPHREDGADCPHCDGTITQKTVAGRAAFYCPTHQPTP